MSDILERLRALRQRKAGGAGPPDPAGSQPLPDEAPEPVKERDPARQSTIDALRAMINTVRDRTGIESPPPAPRLGANGVLSDDVLEGPGQTIEALIPGECLQTPFGPCFRVRSEYPWQYHHGSVPIAETLDLTFDHLDGFFPDERLHALNLNEALFFDTETTGLDTGSGTYIFLAGFGYFEGRNFIVEQFFMRDFPEEPAVIDRVAALLARFRFIVSFNGRTYDWPLLQSRFVMNRRALPASDPPHLDLLTLSRRLFRHTLESCALSSLEQSILGFHRIDDLPGALLPGLFFKYQRSRDARYIHKAFAHNAHDIVSMAALLNRITHLMADPLTWATEPSILYAIGRIKADQGDPSAAETYFRHALNQGLAAGCHRDALERLSLLLKDQQRWDEAVEVWNLMKRAGQPEVFPYVELAKRFEHGLKDYAAAMAEVREAMRIPDPRRFEDRRILQELQHRLNRLEARAAGKPWRGDDREADETSP